MATTTSSKRSNIQRIHFAVSLLLLHVSTITCVAETRESSLALGPAAVDSRLIDTIKYLASDQLEGRGVKTDGINTAADYLAAEFNSMGLRTDWYDGSPFQEFEMSDESVLGPKDENRCAFLHEGKTDSLELLTDFTPLSIGKSGALDHELVFVGYGITAETPAYDDYSELDVDGKVVIMLRREPQQDNPDSEFDGKRSSSHATFRRKIANAVDHGAAGVIIVNDGHTLAQENERQRERLTTNIKRFDKRVAAFNKLENPSEQEYTAFTKRVNALATRIKEATDLLNGDSFDALIQFDHAGSRSFGNLPVLFATRESVAPMIQEATGKSLQDIEAAIDSELQPQSVKLDGWRVQGQTSIESKKLMVKNVLAVLEGEGPLANETIVVGAHYDHLGMGGRGTLAPWTKEIHNGADDNASGTTALVEVARQLASRMDRPRRRIVFIAFTGEESGLLGSKHYVRSPRFPLDDTIAMVNMDMVGRLTDNELTIYGTGSASQFDELVDGLNAEHQFEIKKVPSGYGPSDHASFYGADVPVLFLFTGLHKDYHRPSDDWEKINVGGMRRIVSLAVDIIDSIDAEDSRPEYQKTRRQRMARGDSDRAYLGIMPDPTSSDGLVVQEVVADGPAAEGNMQDGDVILKIGDTEVSDYQTLSEALSKHKPKDVVPVIVERDGQEVKLEIILGSA